MLKLFNVALANHFVKDYKLPILITTSEETFEYELNLYEKNYGSLTKWNVLSDAIIEHFSGNVDMFLTTYAQARDKIITTIESQPEYTEMNSQDAHTKLKEFFKEFPIPTAKYTKGIYNQETINKRFISIDLKKANYQAFKSRNVIKAETYEEFMKTMTDIPFLQQYLADSKYIRVATFGKVNPSRQILIERSILATAYYNVMVNYTSQPDGIDTTNLTLAYFGSDEMVFEVPEAMTDDYLSWLVSDIDAMLKEKVSGIDFRVESYYLEGYEVYVKKPDGHESKLNEFYHRSCDGFKYKAIPLPYNKIITKLLNGEEPNDQDRELMYEKCRVRLLDDIIIKKL